MIHNKKQLVATQKSIEALRESVNSLENAASGSDIDFWQIHAWKSRIEDLGEDIEEFNSLVDKSELEFTAENLHKAVISLRISSGMTQKQLAQAIEVQEQQIQRYEQNQYQTASFERIIQILRVLSHNIELKIALKEKRIAINDTRFKEIYIHYPNAKQAEQVVREREELIAC